MLTLGIKRRRFVRVKRWAGIALLLCAWAGTAAADDWNKSYAVSGKPEVRVESNDGHIDVDTWDRKTIEVRVNTVGWEIGTRGVTITESQTGDRVSLNVRVPNMNWHFGTNNRSVRITLMIPREANLTAETGDGHVNIKSLAGKIDVHTGDGHITVTSLRGTIRLRTGDGHVEGTELDGSLNVQTGDGRVRVSGRFDDLELRTNDGSVDAEVRTGSKIASPWYITTGDGAVRLRMPANFSADLDAHTGDGRIRVEFPITMPAGTISESSVRGQLNGGGQPLRVRTGDGTITISKL
jgi:DUF4097 and DUF4098 domain-containing protein YvlB